MVKPEPLDRKFKEIAERNQLNLFGAACVPLPTWSEHRRGTPNSFLRCALFAATKERGGKMEEQILAGQKDIIVKYSGPQLNQSDLDVWEAIVHLARDPEHKVFGKLCCFTTYEILMALGHKNTGNTDHKWVDSIIKRLNKAHIEIVHTSQPDITYFGYLIEGGKKNSKTKHYDIQLNEGLLALYGSAHWTAIDWDQRKRLQGQDLAKYLHAFYSTHRHPFPVAVASLHAWCGSRNPQIAGFRRQLAQALESLKRIGFLTDAKIEKGNVVVKRKYAQISS
jgi:hypothetical protein